MKKLFSLIILIAFVIGVVIFFKDDKVLKSIIIDTPNSYEIEVNELSEGKNNYYYYNKLNEEQKRMYKIIAEGVKDFKSEIYLDVATQINGDEIVENLGVVMEAFMADYPEVFYINPEYQISAKNVLNLKVLELKLQYLYSESEIKAKVLEINNKLEQIISSNIISGMSEFEKELALHDYLAKSIIYYKYEDIKAVPTEKHNAYDAIILNSAVCDGISKAFQILLNKANIESIMITGYLDKESHAWNIVKIDGAYYHIDLTSDKSLMKDGDMNLIIHSYFNSTTEKISETHAIDKENLIPQCTETKHNYYMYNDYIIERIDNFSYKLNQIIAKQKDKDLIEFSAKNISDVPTQLVETLYNANFNNYKTNGKTKIGYTKVNDNYIVIKE